MTMWKIRNSPIPSSVFSKAQATYERLSASITSMAASLQDHEEELWLQFKTNVQSVTDAFKKCVDFETPSNSFMKFTTHSD